MSADAGEPSPLIETVVTTTGRDGVVNCAAMGVRWGEDELVFWPFDATRTLRNLRVHGEAVVHLTDDVLLFVQAALGHPQPGDAPRQRDRRLGDRGGELVAGGGRDRDQRRAPTSCRALACGPAWWPRGRAASQPLGLCRARHAAVEASIVASRLRWLGGDRVRAELERLQELVDKTAGPRERAAMDYVRRYVAERA